MLRIGIYDLPENKRIEIGLTYIFGIGLHTAQKIISDLNLPKDIRANQLSQEQEKAILVYITDNIVIENTLRKKILENINFLIDINTYQGMRHKAGLPLRSRTRSNARTHKKCRAKGFSFFTKQLIIK